MINPFEVIKWHKKFDFHGKKFENDIFVIVGSAVTLTEVWNTAKAIDPSLYSYPNNFKVRFNKSIVIGNQLQNSIANATESL